MPDLDPFWKLQDGRIYEFAQRELGFMVAFRDRQGKIAVSYLVVDVEGQPGVLSGFTPSTSKPLKFTYDGREAFIGKPLDGTRVQAERFEQMVPGFILRQELRKLSTMFGFMGFTNGELISGGESCWRDLWGRLAQSLDHEGYFPLYTQDGNGARIPGLQFLSHRLRKCIETYLRV